MTRILVDADACPVKEETYKVAYRMKVPVVLVANQFLRNPDHPLITMQVVSDGFDAADDWIAEAASEADLVITADILLAERVLKAGSSALSPKGDPWTPDNIGGAVATRAIMADLRGGIEQGGGPPPFSAKDRSNFLNALDAKLQKLVKQG